MERLIYKDRWKRRSGSQWIPLDNSPTQQSLYHQQVFQKWINLQVSGLSHDCIIAPVVFPIAKWIGTQHCSVPVVHGLLNLQPLINDRRIYLNFEQILQISEAIEDIKAPLPKSSKIPKPILRKYSH